MTQDEISSKIRGAIFTVYNKLGPGLLESSYQAALVFELIKLGLKVESQIPVPMIYETVKLDLGFRIDLLVEGQVVVEIKSVEEINPVHHKQVLTYLVLTNKRLGILVNFNTADISKSIFRKLNGY
jgi:GxxExxY protein